MIPPTQFDLDQTRQRVEHAKVRILSIGRRRRDNAPLWRVTSQQDAGHCYVVVQAGDVFSCTCPAGKYHQPHCIHRDAVRVWLLTYDEAAQSTPAPAPAAETSPALPAQGTPPSREDTRREQERQRQEAAARRDTALLWRDDQGFSLYKS